MLPGVDLISDAANAGDGDGADADPTDEGKDLPNGGSSLARHARGGHHRRLVRQRRGRGGRHLAGANILPVRVLGTQGGTPADIVAGMTWASGGSVPGVPRQPQPRPGHQHEPGRHGRRRRRRIQDAVNAA